MKVLTGCAVSSVQQSHPNILTTHACTALLEDGFVASLLGPNSRDKQDQKHCEVQFANAEYEVENFQVVLTIFPPMMCSSMSLALKKKKGILLNCCQKFMT